MEFDKVIRDRCAIRSFQKKPVEKELLEKILEAGRLAPTAKNNQPQRVYVLQTKESLEMINEASPCIYNAETVLLVCSNKEEAFHKGDYSTYEMDASIVATHMMLEAANLGIDSVWVELFDSNKVKELFELPNEIEPICLLPLGYRDENGKPSENHSKRKPLEETVIYK